MNNTNTNPRGPTNHTPNWNSNLRFDTSSVPSNTDDEIRNKRKAVFASGAGEFWVCDRKGNLEFFGPRARLTKSRRCPQFPSRIAS